MLNAAAPAWERLRVAEADWHRQIRAEAESVARSAHATFRRSGLISFSLTALGIMVAAAVWFALGRLDAPETESAEPAAAEGPAPPEGAPASPEDESPVAAGGGSAGVGGPLSLAGDAVSDELGDVLIDPLFSTDRLDGVAATIAQLADTAALLALQATTEADFGGGAGPGLALVADSVRMLAADAQAAAARVSARLDGLRVSQSVKVISELAATFRGLVEQSHSIAVDIAVEAARAGEEGHNFDEIAAEVDRITGELEARASQVDAVIDCECPPAAVLGGRVAVELRLPREEEPIKVSSTIRRVGGGQLAVEFDASAKAQRRRIATFVCTRNRATLRRRTHPVVDDADF
jgi:hypothetical protein